MISSRGVVSDPLAEQGWFARLLMRNTPLPALLHALMPEFSAREHGRLQFIEDAYLPAAFQRALPQAFGTSFDGRASGSGNFFLHDRQPLRGGVILQRYPDGNSRRSTHCGPAPNAANVAAEQSQSAGMLRTAIQGVLRSAGRSGVRVLEPSEFPVLSESPGPAGTRTAAILIWPAEQPALERWFGSRVADAPVQRQAIPAGCAETDTRAGSASPAEAPAHTRDRGAELSAAVSMRASQAAAEAQSAEAEAAAVGDTEVVVPRQVSVAAVSPDPEPPPVDPTGVVHTANRFAYRVVGHTRGPVAGGRRYHIRRCGSALRVALLADEQSRLPAEDALAFFKRLDFANDLIGSHRSLLRDGPAGIDETVRRSSLALEVDCDSGRFRCVSSGIVPLFFRQQGGRLYALPDAQSEIQSGASDGEGPGLKTVAGRFRSGDALLIVPGGYTGSELRDLAGRHREILAAQLLTPGARSPLAGSDAASGESAPLPTALSAWLDARLRGRGLFLQLAPAPEASASLE